MSKLKSAFVAFVIAWLVVLAFCVIMPPIIKLCIYIATWSWNLFQ